MLTAQSRLYSTALALAFLEGSLELAVSPVAETEGFGGHVELWQEVEVNHRALLSPSKCLSCQQRAASELGSDQRRPNSLWGGVHKSMHIHVHGVLDMYHVCMCGHTPICF